MSNKKLQINHLESKLKVFAPCTGVSRPPTGWIRAIRQALGMSLQQMANKLSVTKQAAQQIELRERDGSITLNSLKDVARAMDLEFVYGFVPKDGSLDALLERKARELALKIVSRTSHSMGLEDQQNSDQRIEQAVKERTLMLKQEQPKLLWD